MNEVAENTEMHIFYSNIYNNYIDLKFIIMVSFELESINK